MVIDKNNVSCQIICIYGQIELAPGKWILFPDVLLEEYCIKDRGKLLKEWSDTKFFTPLAFAFSSL
jgi:hypothetical protein